MKKIITEEQKREIEELAANHWDALVAYGAGMCRTGLVIGAIVAGVGVGIGFIITAAVGRI